MERSSRIFVAGHGGLVGSAFVRRLQADGHDHLLLRRRDALDLTDGPAVEQFFAREKPEYVILAAAKVGGIQANSTYPVDFLRDNLLIATHVIQSAHRHGVQKLLFLGSSCLYPKAAALPIPESALLTGPVEPTNQGYATAKIAGIHLCQAYRRQYGFNAIVLMPSTLYGPGDNFHPEQAHVLPALIRRFHQAKQTDQPQVTVWGTGKPRREFLHVDDLVDAALFLMEHYDQEEVINVGAGEDLSIRELVDRLQQIIGYTGEVVYDLTKPDGAPARRLDLSRLFALGWRPRIPLATGLEATYRWFLDHQGDFRR